MQGKNRTFAGLIGLLLMVMMVVGCRGGSGTTGTPVPVDLQGAVITGRVLAGTEQNPVELAGSRAGHAALAAAPDAQALAGAEVRVLDRAGVQLATTTAAEDGSFRFEDLPTGLLTIETRLDPAAEAADASRQVTAYPLSSIDLGVTHAIDREQAMALALMDIPGDALVLGSMQPLSAGTRVFNRNNKQDGQVSEIERTLAADEWFFFVDLDTLAGFDHPVKYIFVNATTAEVTTLEESAPPEVNYGALWASERDFVVFTGIDFENLEYGGFPAGATATPTAEVVQLPDFIDLQALAALRGEPATLVYRALPSGGVVPYFHNVDAASIFTLTGFGDDEYVRGMNEATWKEFLGRYGARPNHYTWNSTHYDYIATARDELNARLRTINERIATRLEQQEHSTLILYLNGHSTHFERNGSITPTGKMLFVLSGERQTEYKELNASSLFGGGTGELASTKACRVRILLDTCYAEVFAEGLARIFSALPENQRPDVRIFASSLRNESSYKTGLLIGLLTLTQYWGSYFTDTVLNGDGVRLAGGDLDGMVGSDGELYTDFRTISSRQHPRLIKVNGSPEWCEEDDGTIIDDGDDSGIDDGTDDTDGVGGGTQEPIGFGLQPGSVEYVHVYGSSPCPQLVGEISITNTSNEAVVFSHSLPDGVPLVLETDTVTGYTDPGGTRTWQVYFTCASTDPVNLELEITATPFDAMSNLDASRAVTDTVPVSGSVTY